MNFEVLILGSIVALDGGREIRKYEARTSNVDFMYRSNTNLRPLSIYTLSRRSLYFGPEMYRAVSVHQTLLVQGTQQGVDI